MGTSTEINNMVSILTFNGRWRTTLLIIFLIDLIVFAVFTILITMILTIIRTSADYSVLLSSVYLQDEIRLSPKFNVLAGIRVDWQNTPTAFLFRIK
jgi:outer membrane receptor protein involved in Fe transport